MAEEDERMDTARIQDIFEAYFEKYKKTEGDRTVWSAYWTVFTPGRSFEINLTKCPLGARFKIFHNGQKIEEITGWDAFLVSLDRLEAAHGPDFEREDFFGQMADML
jgi:hypothetical protein